MTQSVAPLTVLRPEPQIAAPVSSPLPRPLGLVAELTYRCPLHCPYCSNPVAYPTGTELSTEEWSRVFDQAAGIGVVHALLTGGEPLARSDLAELIAAARKAGLYTNLITSAVGLTRSRAESLKAAGLDSVQISFQADQAEAADAIAGATAHAVKLEAARLVRELGLPLTINVVLHRGNIDRIGETIQLAETLGASRLELANVQFYGWAFRNRSALLPTRMQIDRASAIATAAKERLRGAMEVLYVLPDYFGDRPKPCMNGWGRRYIAVNPVGDVLPCPTAFEIPSLRFDNVREHDVGWIWAHSEAFNRFRGTAWMPEPCQSCDRKEIDFGGCRCQAALLTGDPANTDPACGLSPQHKKVQDLADRPVALDTAESAQMTFRINPPNRR
jgi:pyrroloquinoline quinone biosynthesis protein E